VPDSALTPLIPWFDATAFFADEATIPPTFRRFMNGLATHAALDWKFRHRKGDAPESEAIRSRGISLLFCPAGTSRRGASDG
jgi:hypothetical protein